MEKKIYTFLNFISCLAILWAVLHPVVLILDSMVFLGGSITTGAATMAYASVYCAPQESPQLAFRMTGAYALFLLTGFACGAGMSFLVNKSVLVGYGSTGVVAGMAIFFLAIATPLKPLTVWIKTA